MDRSVGRARGARTSEPVGRLIAEFAGEVEEDRGRVLKKCFFFRHVNEDLTTKHYEMKTHENPVNVFIAYSYDFQMFVMHLSWFYLPGCGFYNMKNPLKRP